MKIWKQISACCLAAAMAVSLTGTAFAGSPEFARSEADWAKLRDNVIEYDELPGLIHEYNVTVQNNQRDYNQKRNKTSNEISQDYRDAAASIRNTISGDDSVGSILSDAMAEAQAQSMDQQADDNVNDSQIYLWTDQQTEATLVSNAQANMVSYEEKELDLALKQKNRDVLSATYDSVVLKKSKGLAPQLDVLTARENLQNADAAILAARTELENTKQKLQVMLGWKYDAVPDLRAVPAADLNRIAVMDPAADKEKALENNYTLKINERKLANSAGVSGRDSLKMTIEDNKQRIASSVDEAYKNVLQAQSAYQQASVSLAAAVKTKEIADQKLQLQMISNLDHLSQEYAFLQAQTAMKNADMGLFQAMESYDWNIKGLSSAAAGM